MNRLLRVEPALATPIWSQIEEGMRRLVASGALGPGQAVPSVRDFACELRVNPATVSKAYPRLTEQGVLEVRRDGAARYASLGLTLGASREEALDELRAAWTELGRRGKGEER